MRCCGGEKAVWFKWRPTVYITESLALFYIHNASLTFNATTWQHSTPHITHRANTTWQHPSETAMQKAMTGTCFDSGFNLSAFEANTYWHDNICIHALLTLTNNSLHDHKPTQHNVDYPQVSRFPSMHLLGNLHHAMHQKLAKSLVLKTRNVTITI